MYSDIRQFLHALYKHGEVVDVFAEVDPDLEIAEIHRQVAAADGPALFFHNVKGSKFPVVTNLFGSHKRVNIAFGNDPQKEIESIVHLLTKNFPPKLSSLWKHRHLLKVGTKKVKKAPILENVLTDVDLEAIPLLKSWPLDGGHFVTLPLVYTKQETPNLGMYRIQRFNKREMGLHFQIGKGGGFHYDAAERNNEELPVTIFIGASPALILSAITPLPENVPELLLASFLQKEKIPLATSSRSVHPLFAHAEFAITGTAKPHERRLEGPFGDHYGYYSLAHDFPVLNVSAIHHRNDAIYPATVVGKPRQEDFYIGNMLQKLLSPLFPVVMPGVKSLWSYGETGFHSLAAAVVKERFARECMQSAFRILGEGQLSLTKSLLVTNQDVDLEDFKTTLQTVLERINPETDLFVFSNLSLDTLDYTGPNLNHGSRLIMLGLGEKKRDLPTTYQGSPPRSVKKVAPFIPGCLVVEVPPYLEFQEIESLYPHFTSWPLVILVDSLDKTLKNDSSFLWTTFTRFEPAADLHTPVTKVHRHHLCYSFPIIIDARMKPSYPAELLPDEATHERVKRRWNEYFPSGCAQGDSLAGHVN